MPMTMALEEMISQSHSFSSSLRSSSLRFATDLRMESPSAARVATSRPYPTWAARAKPAEAPARKPAPVPAGPPEVPNNDAKDYGAGTRGSVRIELGGRRKIKHKNKPSHLMHYTN